ncbi:MAG: hypothetical protein EOP49_28605 [Sphingobacteriales bacterium]|nr:MAG: hypothetical protein EOP49_28605 [Sphingobacteriales bacterium]
MKRWLTIFILPLNLIVSAQTASNEAEYLHRAQEALTEVIVHDIFSPPVASRIYLYSNLAASYLLSLYLHQCGALSVQEL